MSISENRLTENMWVLSNRYPFICLAASIAFAGEENSKNMNLKTMINQKYLKNDLKKKEKNPFLFRPDASYCERALRYFLLGKRHLNLEVVKFLYYKNISRDTKAMTRSHGGQQSALCALFLKGQGHQDIFSLGKGNLWGNCEFLLAFFKGTRWHWDSRLRCLCEVTGLALMRYL